MKEPKKSMNPSQDFNLLYSDVSGSIASAMTQIADLKVEHKEGKQEISNIMEKLRDIQARFDGELSLLEQHAEWDKFTMAFLVKRMLARAPSSSHCVFCSRKSLARSCCYRTRTTW